jgi:hypothetical protein
LAVWKLGARVVCEVIFSESIGVMAPDHSAAGKKDSRTSVTSGTDKNHGNENDTLGIDAAWTNWSALRENVREGMDAVKEDFMTMPIEGNL